MFEFASRLCRGKAPLESGLGRIAASCPSGDRAADPRWVCQTSVQALARYHREFDFRHVEPTAMLGRIVQIQLPQNTARFGRGKGRVQRGWRMGVQVVQHDTHHGRLGIMDVHQVFHTGGKILGGTPVGDLDMPPALGGFNKHQQVTRALPTIFISRSAAVGPDRRAALGELR